MPLRPFKLPNDFATLMDVIPPAFQYPENPAWSVQEDEMQSMVDAMRGLRRLWPVMRVIGMLSPQMRDAFSGFVWEEDGQPVGLSNVIRQGQADSWLIGNVAVLPAYRRRGIARKLVEACVDLAKQKKAQTITLDVVAGNIPAYELYKKLGFEAFSGQVELVYSRAEPPSDGDALPAGYSLAPRKQLDWRPRFALAQRIVPEAVRRYDPVVEARYRPPVAVRFLIPVLRPVMGMKAGSFTLIGPGGEVVATAGYDARLHEGGVNSLNIMFDPAHAAAAPALVRYLVREVISLSPGRRIEFQAKAWQEPVIAAALEAGFEKRADFHTMGIVV